MKLEKKEVEQAAEMGLSKIGTLPGTIKYPRKARRDNTRSGFTGKIFAYRLAVSEETSLRGLAKFNFNATC